KGRAGVTTAIKNFSRFPGGVLLFLVISALWLYAFPAATALYVIVVLFHVVAGVILAFLLAPQLLAALKSGPLLARSGWIVMALAAGLGVLLIFKGAVRAEWNVLYLHIASAAVGSVLLFTLWLRQHGVLRSKIAATGAVVALTLALVP